MHRDRILPQRMHAACRTVTRGPCCTKRFAEFNGNGESYCSLEQLVTLLSAADEGKNCCRYVSSEDRRLLHQKTLVQTIRFAVLRGVHLVLYSSTSYVKKSVTVRVCVCATCSLLGTSILSVVMCNQTQYDLLQMMISLLLCRQQGGEPTKRHMECGTAGEKSMPPLKCGCFSSAA